MQFALVDNKKSKAEKGLNGICSGCLEPVVAKCGDQKIHHWAHKGNKVCDNWWELETEWHREWKNLFPIEWQENYLTDEKTGEKHFADILTSNGLIVEFQHSHINSEERNKRESFYKNMIWVVDGTRLIRDFPRLIKSMEENFINTRVNGAILLHFPDWSFPKNWCESKVPVLFDFHNFQDDLDPDNEYRNYLWCLLPEPVKSHAVLLIYKRDDFIKMVNDNPMFLPMSPKQITDAFIVRGYSTNNPESNLRFAERLGTSETGWKIRKNSL